MEKHVSLSYSHKNETDELKKAICRLNDCVTEISNAEVIVLNEENETSSLSNAPQLDIKQEQCETLTCEVRVI